MEIVLVEAIAFFTIVWGYALGMIVMAYVMHFKNK
tara:strand:+ start:2621 stop:2725 length:105 start_codon:yes stop_codon:yes gene_type:complete